MVKAGGSLELRSLKQRPGMMVHLESGGSQKDLCEFETSVVYRASYRAAWATQTNPVSKTNKKVLFIPTD